MFFFHVFSNMHCMTWFGVDHSPWSDNLACREIPFAITAHCLLDTATLSLHSVSMSLHDMSPRLHMSGH